MNPPLQHDPPGVGISKYRGSKLLLESTIDAFLKRPRLISVRELATLREYCREWIRKPVWAENPHDHSHEWASHLAYLRRTVDKIDSPAALCLWIAEASKYGAEPFR